ncbi:MAG: hypothetical protein KDA32_01250 [Phycisphaerales bacterium]|nr:hypothetical protein [Phycisphaerales bacterium]
MSEHNSRLADRYEELRLFPQSEDADAALQEWHTRLYLMPGFWLALLAYAATFGAVAYVVLKAIKRSLPQIDFSDWPYRIAISVSFVISFSLAIWYGGFWLWRRRFRRFLRERLTTLGVPVCLGCGYDLRGQEEPRCPECGRGF